jgi:hypothetical protein
MRYNRLGQIAYNFERRAIAVWKTDAVSIEQQPVNDADRDGAWRMVEKVNGTYVPVLDSTGKPLENGCNALAAGNGRWMRRFDAAAVKLSGSQAWTPADGRVGDISGEWACTVSADARTLFTWKDGALVSQRGRGAYFDEVRIKSGLMAWSETPGPVIRAVDLETGKPLEVQQLGPQAYTPIVFRQNGAIWVVYQCDAMGGLCHRIDDNSKGYRFGIPAQGKTPNIYNPDVWLHDNGEGCTIGWSTDPGEFAQGALVITVLGEAMVPLALPAPSRPIGLIGNGSPLPEGTWVDVHRFFEHTPEFWPRGGGAVAAAKGDTHKLDMQLVTHNGLPCFWHNKFEINGELGELLCVDGNKDIHLLADCSDQNVIDIWSHSLWLKGRMQIGRQHGFVVDCRLSKRRRSDGSEIRSEDFSKEMWLHAVYQSWWGGDDLGECLALVYVYNNTGIRAGQTGTNPENYVEYYVELIQKSTGKCAGWAAWASERSTVVFATTSDYTLSALTSPAKFTKFYHLGGRRFTPQIPAFIPGPTITTAPPAPSGLVKPEITVENWTLNELKDGREFKCVDRMNPGFGFRVHVKAGAMYAEFTNPAGTGKTGLARMVTKCPSVEPPPPPPPTPPPLPPPIPPGGAVPNMHAWPKFGGSYATGPWRRDYDPSLFASLNRDAGGDFTRYWLLDAWGVAPNGPGQHAGIQPWLRDSAGVFDLSAPNPEWDDRLNRCVRIQNNAGATVQLSVLNLYSWSTRTEGRQWVPDPNLGPFRRNRNGVRWDDDTTFDRLPDWVVEQLIARACAAVNGLAVQFEVAGNEFPEKSTHVKMAAMLKSHFTATWRPDISCNRNEDTPGQYFNMKIGRPIEYEDAVGQFDLIAYHGKDRLSYLDEVDEDEPSHRPNTFRKLWDQSWDEGRVDPGRIIMSSDGCRKSGGLIDDCYEWDVLAEVFRDHVRRGFTIEHQSRIKMRPFLENRLDLRDFEGDWLRSIRR